MAANWLQNGRKRFNPDAWTDAVDEANTLAKQPLNSLVQLSEPQLGLWVTRRSWNWRFRCTPVERENSHIAP